eukprot:c18660_g1_i1 orf=3-413(-)
MACRDLDLLWKEYFRDSSQFRDCGNSKRGPRSPDFRHKQTKEPLWMDGWQLRRSGARDGVFSVRKAGGEVLTGRPALMDLIKTCGIQKDLHMGSKLHVDILNQGLLKKDTSLGNALLSMYAKCGSMAKAQELFDQLP